MLANDQSTPNEAGYAKSFGAWRDFWAVYVVAAYTLSVALIAALTGNFEYIPRGIYFAQWMFLPSFTCAGYIFYVVLRGLIARRPWPATLGDIHLLGSPRIVSGSMIFAALGIFYGSFTSMKTMMNKLTPLVWDRTLADVDLWLHGRDVWHLIPLDEAFTRFVQMAYLPLWLTLLSAVSFYVCLFADEKLREQYLKTFFFCWIVLGNILAYGFMSGGPVFYQAITGSHRFAELTQYLGFSHGMPYSSIDIADRLWRFYAADANGEGSGISAFPSLHLAMATLWMMTFWDRFPRLRVIWIGFVALIQIGSVHLGWHYAVDGYAAIILTAGAWYCFKARTPAEIRGPRFSAAYALLRSARRIDIRSPGC